MQAIRPEQLSRNSLQSLPDIHQVELGSGIGWPEYLAPQDDPVSAQRSEARSVEAGYEQSHPYGFMFTSKDLAVDQATLNNNYMKLIFGGKPSESDNIVHAYKHSARQMAEAPVAKDSLLGEQDPLAFVSDKPVTAEDLYKTFEEQRQYYKGAIDTDAERALKSRVTHRMINHTYYGKDQLRFNHVRGQATLLNRPTDLEGFRPWEGLSSRTYAPDGVGGEVPLDAEIAYGDDPRDVRIDTKNAKVRPNPVVDLGAYFGSGLEKDETEGPGGLVGLFGKDARVL